MDMRAGQTGVAVYPLRVQLPVGAQALVFAQSAGKLHAVARRAGCHDLQINRHSPTPCGLDHLVHEVGLRLRQGAGRAGLVAQAFVT